MAETEKDTKPAGTESHDPDHPEKLLEFMRTGWLDTGLDVAPVPQAPHYAKRRAAVAEAFPGEALVIPTGTERVRANDTVYPFRPGTDFAYLTGDHDPDSVLIIRPGGAATLYMRPRAPPGALDDLAPGHTRVLRGLDPAVDQAVLGKAERDTQLAQTLSELRLVQDEWEIAQLRDAIAATVHGFEDVARILPADRPVAERLLEGVFGMRARHDGNDAGYSSIVGAGRHATILHWTRNTGHTSPGELLLMDMGVENRALYTADVTRVLPVSGTFTPLQRRIYDLVHASQQAGIDTIAPGVKYDDVHQACMRVLAEGLHDLGLLPVSVDEAMDKQSTVYRRWTLHGFGHMLGMDVHDCARARKERYRDGTLGEGYVLTVEPGLYFQPEDDLVPPELHGIGVRIEDDVLVTAQGAEVLSAGLPRASGDVETWLAAQRDAGPRLPN